MITRRDAISPASFIGDRIGLAVIPGSRAIDITSPHEWWICERLKQKRKIVFVVAGDTTTGMGHIYRSLQIAHEINNHEVAFVCIPESRLAHDMISSNGYSSVLAPADGVLSDVVLSEFPDMVVNDMLDTSAEYVSALRTAGARVVNFEDLGPGADEADLVINELYMEETPKSNHRVGPEFFCIREEFLSARPSVWRADPGEILLTFGGTDSENLTARVLRVIWPEAERRRVRVSVVTGFGYEHAAGLERLVGEIGSSRIQVANGTKRMSEFMGRVDLAFSSSGRTLFELATMRVPSIVIACNEREERHPFASSSAGFRYLGRHDRVRDEVIRRAFVEILDSADIRRRMYDSLSRLDFRNGKQRVLDAFSAVLGIPMR